MFEKGDIASFIYTWMFCIFMALFFCLQRSSSLLGSLRFLSCLSVCFGFVALLFCLVCFFLALLFRYGLVCCGLVWMFGC